MANIGEGCRLKNKVTTLATFHPNLKDFSESLTAAQVNA